MFIKEADVEAVSERIKHGRDIEEPTTPMEYFYRYFTSSLRGDDRLSGLMDLVCSGNAKKYVYVTNVISSSWLHDKDSKVAEYMVRISSLCADEYLANPYDICPKIDYYKKDMLLENLNHILILAKAMDKKSIMLFFNLLDSKRIYPGDYIDLLKYLSKNNIHRAFGYLGEIYYYGLEVQKSADKAMDMYLKGKAFGDPVSCNGIGRILMSSEYEDYGSAKNHFDLASMSGILNETEYRLYELYTNHLMMPDYGKFYLTKSMSMGFLPAIYKDGLGYFEKKDYASTIIRLEPILDYSRPVIDFQNLAHRFLKNKKYLPCLVALLASVELGSRSSLDNAIYILENHNLLEDQDKILFGLYMRQMREGVNKNLNRIGDCYFYGRGVEQSYVDAFSYYLSSSVLRNTEGIVSVAYMYEKGLGVEKSLWKSFSYIRQIEVDDKNYLLLFYLYIFFFAKVFLFNKYILGFTITSLVIFQVGRKYKKTE
ncbi:Protein sel-1 like protein 2 [Nosema granulosis]|uniref:Protein sel-1 like protein 2 n=1 Tax=Nosema granulosis TaxID=83296 RepID=A0A9P6GYD9_9MICR|nr:Protein sel-1 like protein 2 [Nosema granulosis]